MTQARAQRPEANEGDAHLRVNFPFDNRLPPFVARTSRVSPQLFRIKLNLLAETVHLITIWLFMILNKDARTTEPCFWTHIFIYLGLTVFYDEFSSFLSRCLSTV